MSCRVSAGRLAVIRTPPPALGQQTVEVLRADGFITKRRFSAHRVSLVMNEALRLTFCDRSIRPVLQNTFVFQ